MATESLDGITGDIGPLARALGDAGGGITFTRWVEGDGSVHVLAHLPDDLEGVAECRRIIEAARDGQGLR